MIIGYSRVSTADQTHALQLDALKAAGCDRIFSDTASGAKEDRVELKKCLAFLQKGDTLVVYKLDRIGRSLKHLINTVLGLNERGVNIVITTMNIDTRTPTGRLLLAILSGVADFERELIRERVNSGIKAAKVRGVRFGRPNLVTPELLEQARELVTTQSVRNAAKQLGVSKSALYGALHG